MSPNEAIPPAPPAENAAADRPPRPSAARIGAADVDGWGGGTEEKEELCGKSVELRASMAAREGGEEGTVGDGRREASSSEFRL